MNELAQRNEGSWVSRPLTTTSASVTAIATLLITLVLLAWLNRPEQVPGTNVLEDFPMDLSGRWLGTNLEVSQREREILRATGIVMRSYVSVNHEPASVGIATEPSRSSQASQPAVLYVAFYHSQRTGATYHSPQNCMPGAGWQMTSITPVTLPASLGVNAHVNEVVLQKGLEKQLVMYWYQDRGRVIADEYWAKAYMIWDASTNNRSDGSLVRLSVMVTEDLDAARVHLGRFLVDLWPVLDQTLPGRQ